MVVGLCLHCHPCFTTAQNKQQLNLNAQAAAMAQPKTAANFQRAAFQNWIKGANETELKARLKTLESSHVVTKQRILH